MPLGLTLRGAWSGLPRGPPSLTWRDAADPALADAAKTLRLLHLAELKALQARVSNIIVDFQRITANPRTDASLGKVGI